MPQRHKDTKLHQYFFVNHCVITSLQQSIFIFLFLFASSATIQGQTHATCDDAIPVTTSTYGPITAQGWADPSLCVPNNETMYFGKTHQVVWFSFIVPYDTVLTFQIVPENPTDDFDFILFKADKGDFCMKEKERKVKPIRSNFAKPTEYSKGVTGLSAKGTEAFVAPGFNSPNSLPVEVKKGEWYYLAVDNYVNNKGGFTLKLPFRFNNATPVSTFTPPGNTSTIDAAPIKAPPIEQAAKPNFYIHVLDSASHSIKASLIIEGFQKSGAIKADTSDYSLRLKEYQTIKIRANAAGYMPYQSTYSATGDTSTATFWIRLEPIRVSQKITIKDINFLGDSPVMTLDSKPACDYLLQFLLSNPGVKIIIKGYTNDPTQERSASYDLQLSEKRANAVKEYLSLHGISKKRMTCVGYGNTKMLYMHPINEEQRIANRRVEIEIQ